MKDEIIAYYNELANEYDKDRFANSYGNYIHKQENIILKKYINQENIDKNLDIACGTGRFLNYADYGIDISPNMVKISKQKFPNKNIIQGDATKLHYNNSYFNHVISFHLFMHLDELELTKILKQVNKVLKTEGLFIFDIPSKKRRKFTGYKASSWHGGYQISKKELAEITKNNWKIINYHGIAFFPIHKIPKVFRKYVLYIDNLLSNSFLKEYSSHIVYILQKK